MINYRKSVPIRMYASFCAVDHFCTTAYQIITIRSKKINISLRIVFEPSLHFFSLLPVENLAKYYLYMPLLALCLMKIVVRTFPTALRYATACTTVLF